MTLKSNDYVVTMTAVTVVGTDHVETTTASKEENTAAPEAANKRFLYFLYLLLDIAFDRCIVSSWSGVLPLVRQSMMVVNNETIQYRQRVTKKPDNLTFPSLLLRHGRISKFI